MDSAVASTSRSEWRLRAKQAGMLLICLTPDGCGRQAIRAHHSITKETSKTSAEKPERKNKD
jgi:hypothetical protein